MCEAQLLGQLLRLEVNFGTLGVCEPQELDSEGFEVLRRPHMEVGRSSFECDIGRMRKGATARPCTFAPAGTQTVAKVVM